MSFLLGIALMLFIFSITELYMLVTDSEASWVPSLILGKSGTLNQSILVTTILFVLIVSLIFLDKKMAKN